jgi:hypothetical protein
LLEITSLKLNFIKNDNQIKKNTQEIW